MQHVYVFVLSPPFSGSTILYRLIGTSHQASTLFGNRNWAGEGQFLPSLAPIMRARPTTDPRIGGFWDPTVMMPWEQIKHEWDKHWDPSKLVHVEKSPPNICRAKHMQDYFGQFGEVYFIALIRNPYACKQRAELSLEQARYQKSNIENLKNILWLTYEELCAEPLAVAQRIRAFVPALGELDLNRQVKGVTGERAEIIENKNLYTKSLVTKRNEELAHDEKLLQIFGYPLLDPNTLNDAQPEIEVERTICGSAERIFEAWMNARDLGAWWDKATVNATWDFEFATSFPGKPPREIFLTGKYEDIQRETGRFCISINEGCLDEALENSLVEVQIRQQGLDTVVTVRHLQIPRSFFKRATTFWTTRLSALESYITAEARLLQKA